MTTPAPSLRGNAATPQAERSLPIRKRFLRGTVAARGLRMGRLLPPMRGAPVPDEQPTFDARGQRIHYVVPRGSRCVCADCCAREAMQAVERGAVEAEMRV